MLVYIIQYQKNHTEPVVSSEGYKTLEEAQEFCKKRQGKIEQVGPFLFISSDENGNNGAYKILEIRVA